MVLNGAVETEGATFARNTGSVRWDAVTPPTVMLCVEPPVSGRSEGATSVDTGFAVWAWDAFTTVAGAGGRSPCSGMSFGRHRENSITGASFMGMCRLPTRARVAHEPWIAFSLACVTVPHFPSTINP